MVAGLLGDRTATHAPGICTASAIDGTANLTIVRFGTRTHWETGGVEVRATIPYAGGELEATLDGETWRVRLGELEESSLYLDYAVSSLLDVETRDVHQLAARLIERILTQAQRLPAAPKAGASLNAGSSVDRDL